MTDMDISVIVCMTFLLRRQVKMTAHQNQFFSLIEEILSLDTDDIPDFITQCRIEQRLSKIIHELNQALTTADLDTRYRAQTALNHMGFI